MDTLIRVLLVDDHKPWRRFASDAIRHRPEIEIVGEASDGIEAVRIAQKLQPDLVLLDIGLPRMNGIEAAREIRGLCPNSKILFMSENRSADIAEEALSTGAGGYIVKSDAARELLPAIETIFTGKQFISRSLPAFASSLKRYEAAVASHCHEVAFYARDISLVEGYARFIENALSGGNATIVVVTAAHRADLIPKLQVNGVNVDHAIQKGRYIPLDVADTMASLTVNNMPDPTRCMKVIGGVIGQAVKGVTADHARVMACGEIAPTMLSQGNAEGAIQFEHLWDEIARDHGVQTHCGYVWSALLRSNDNQIFDRICAEHSATCDCDVAG